MPKNVIGPNVRAVRRQSVPPVTQQELAARLQAVGLNIDRAGVSKIEAQLRLVRDYEVEAIATALSVPMTRLYGQ